MKTIKNSNKALNRLLFIVALMTNSLINCQTIEITDYPEANLYSKADSLIYEYVKSGKLLGVTSGVIRNDEIIWQNAFGYRDVQNKIIADTSMVHRIASLTKPMTSAAIFKLVEKGLLELDKPIQSYLPEFPEKSEGSITIRQLLNHSSGIKGYRVFENRPTTEYSTLSDAIKLFYKRKLKSNPGEMYNYSTYGYVVLGAIIERVTGLSYNEFMKNTIWTKSGMLNTTVEIFNHKYENKAELYKKTNNGFKKDKITNLSIKSSGGGVQSTSGDMLRFARAFMNNKIINASSKSIALSIPDIKRNDDDINYAHGWIVYHHKDLGLIHYHDGHQSGTSTILTVIPSKKLAVVVLANSSNSENEVRNLANSLLDEFLK